MQQKYREIVLRYGPALAMMVVIFLFSATPAKGVVQVADPVITYAPKTIPSIISQYPPLQINWLKVGHVIGYGLLGMTYLHAIGQNRQYAWLQVMLYATLFAVTDEFHQQFTPGRSAGTLDVVIDVTSATTTALILSWIGQLNSKKYRRI